MLFAENMECPLSKEELLELVEEEARLRVSADFLNQVEQLYFLSSWSRRNTIYLLMFLF